MPLAEDEARSINIGQVLEGGGGEGEGDSLTVCPKSVESIHCFGN